MSDSPVRVSVVQGTVHVNEIALERASEDVLVFQGDLREKYPDICGYGGSSKELSVVLYPEKHVKDEVPTQVVFTGDFSGHWQVFAEAVRYTLTVMLFRPNPEAEVVWQDAAPPEALDG